ncbi:Imidazole glycerol phosphate synthase subunit HisH [Zhongshania aliphaticivorans]|uniref:Imidazole glycerol phosphate synthase subunit HisH n=1 Tax=Zhongshania aliphaticivorans TaxID=1470434 RepID=A0A5S9N9A5_9GAMM|nr:imidazole glycerol phosphate synthase subunit HisH [Zhongshania aliphaticivorans]CAA0078544.1 Imidazole glycerol phosphate synthase subunit HisH [Zhongshania aliphaticivorans]CAA0086650.1 Imidazole glycerol phosphate synthase subunit HisH [Zhongshania aliphaticivorans]CAA0102199.1 Imidazole glycerol phosphate synthase subunit HisH [Zhongshania aliphaticivorans]
MSSSSVAVIDYGMGNLHSVASALEKVGDGVNVIVTDSPEAILAADRVIFPGVGAIRDCMAELKARGLDEVIQEVAAQKPLLGICLGMQALLENSEENGGVECLDILPGSVKFFGADLRDSKGARLKVPHMGWNNVAHTQEHPLWDGIDDASRFYFVHSYYVDAPDFVAGTAEYGVQVHAALACENVFAVQFHPEKSGDAGLRLLSNFLKWDRPSANFYPVSN